MSERYETLAARIDERFGEQMRRLPSICGELSYELDKDDLTEIATALRNEADFGFEMLMDVCGVDYLNYGDDEWTTNDATGTGFSRGVERGCRCSTIFAYGYAYIRGHRTLRS
jgi:NADH-quinone oxidoreductase subunit C